MTSDDISERPLPWKLLHKSVLTYSATIFAVCFYHRWQAAAWTDLVMYGGAHFASLLFAVGMRRAMAVKDVWVAAAFALYSVAFAYETAVGMTKVLTNLSLAIALIGASAEQAFLIGGEHIQDKERKITRAAEAREAEDARLALGVVQGAALVAATSPIAAPSTTAPPTVSDARQRPAHVSSYRGYADAKAHAIALSEETPERTQAQIAEIVGVPRSTVGRWLREVKKDR